MTITHCTSTIVWFENRLYSLSTTANEYYPCLFYWI